MQSVKKLVAAALSAQMLLAAIPCVPASAYTLNTPTPEQIREFYNSNPFTFDIAAYAAYPVTKSPYEIGRLSDACMQNGLHALNFVRFVAGLPADVTINDKYCELTQASSLVNAVNNKLSHYPTQPADMDNTLFQLAASGATQSNIARGYHNLPASIIGYVEDSDDSNMDVVGHRRWMLNPAMQQTGFGMAGDYSAVYSVDRSRAERFEGDYVCWPAQNMPYELYDVSDRYAFSVSLSLDYINSSWENVTVDVSSKKLGKTYHLDTSDNQSFDYYFAVNDQNYGSGLCLIFNAGVMFDVDDTVSVKIDGLTKNKKPASISYDVNFFCLDENTASKTTETTEDPNVIRSILGDINLDGQLTIADAVIVSRLASEEEGLIPHPAYAIFADCTQDSVLDARDVFYILKRLKV